MRTKKAWLAALGITCGIAVPFLPALGELSVEARSGMGILIWAIAWWVLQIVPEYITAMLMAFLYIVIAKVPTKVVLSMFSGPTWWLLFTAFGLSLAMMKSGLLNRIAFYILKLFPKSFNGQVLGMLAVGAVTAPFIPSLSAKSAMMAPLSMGISDSMGYARKGSQANGLFLAMLVGIRNPAPVFISASILGYAFMGLYPADIQGRYTMGYWFLCALPWGVVVSLLNYFAITRIYGKSASKAHVASTSSAAPIRGPMSVQEKQVFAIMLLTLLLWVTESLHGIPAHVVALGAFCLILMLGIVDRSSFKTDINWDALIFIGIALGLSSVFEHLGIDRWIVEICGPFLNTLAKDPYLLVLGVGCVTVLLRFVIVSEVAYVNIFMVFMIPMAASAGINSWVIGMAVYCLVSPWFVMYQNPVYMAAYFAVGGLMASHASVVKYCMLYVLICLIGLACSVPIWLKAEIFYL